MGRPRTPLLERLATQVEIDADGCWLRTHGRQATGYTLISLGGRKSQMVLAHRLAYEVHIGPIPDGLTIDHICHEPETCQGGVTCKHRRCVNPDHLRLATMRENLLRGNALSAKNAAKTHCKRGHPFDERNTYIDANGGRICRRCKLEWWRRNKAAALVPTVQEVV